MTIPQNLKIYHIVHVDRLKSIIEQECLWCDAEINKKNLPGTEIGMNKIKQRRLNELMLKSHPGLYVGQFVPFYFCPRSVMLYLIYMHNEIELGYQGGQDLIIHLEADLKQTVTWAEQNKRKWAFTSSNAGSRYFEDFKNLSELNKIDWEAVKATNWMNCKEDKQAEFLLEYSFPLELVIQIGVINNRVYQQVKTIFENTKYKPKIEIKPDWYY